MCTFCISIYATTHRETKTVKYVLIITISFFFFVFASL